MPPTSFSERSWTDTAKATYTDAYNAVEPTASYYLSLIPDEAKLVVAGLGGGVLMLGSVAAYKRFVRRIPSAEFVSAKDLQRKRWIKGVVTSVGDADNFRLYHTPGIGWRWPIKFRFVPKDKAALKDQTLHIRMAGADAPEAAHFGKPSQPYSAEALEWLRGSVLGKRVWCQLLRHDQYRRIVAIPLMPTMIPFRCHNLSLEMIRAGWATVYEQANAEYGKEGKEHYLAVEAAAKAARRGMWEKGVDGETPAEYKRRHAAGAAAAAKKV